MELERYVFAKGKFRPQTDQSLHKSGVAQEMEIWMK